MFYLNHMNFILPPHQGTYALIFSLNQSVNISIGSLGIHRLSQGYYIYSGSAHGKGGIRARVCHHLSSQSKAHWHMDYLRGLINITNCLFFCTSKNYECAWSHALESLIFTSIPVTGFGASDCTNHCKAHMFSIGKNLQLNIIHDEIQKTVNGKVFVIILTPQSIIL